MKELYNCLVMGEKNGQNVAKKKQKKRFCKWKSKMKWNEEKKIH